MGSPTITEGIHSDNYRFLQEYVYSQAGIVLEHDKHYLFESRLAPIVRQLGLGSINDLCALLQATRGVEVGRQVAEAMTTNETYFFRDPSHYDAIRGVLLPRLREERRGYQEVVALVGCRIDRAGSVQPGHASAGERVWRLEHSNSGHGLLVAGSGTRPGPASTIRLR